VAGDAEGASEVKADVSGPTGRPAGFQATASLGHAIQDGCGEVPMVQDAAQAPTGPICPKSCWLNSTGTPSRWTSGGAVAAAGVVSLLAALDYFARVISSAIGPGYV
jgi:hypothetical protein